ncbi:MAG TPA: biopolymer transporter ExbD [Burkholderiales bacterium]|nr:biopolymer transporter ExbD [Burkholderiales bacterium]
MAFGGFESGGEHKPMAEINMIPLIDVMLVLLVIFIITAPLLTHSVRIDLPKAANRPTDTRPSNVQLAIGADGVLHWNGETVDRGELRQRLAAASRLEPQPELHLRVDRATPFQTVAEVMADAAKSGLVKIGFVSDPKGAV